MERLGDNNPVEQVPCDDVFRARLETQLRGRFEEAEKVERVVKMASGFLDFMNENLDVGERIPLDSFRPDNEPPRNCYLIKTESGLVIEYSRNIPL